MSIRAIKWAYSLKLPATTKFVLVTLAEHADDDGECWPLQTRIAEMTGLTDRTVRYVVHGLKASGLLKSCGGKGRSSTFFLALEVTEIDVPRAEIIARECASTSKKKASPKQVNRNEIPKNRNQMPTPNRNQIPIDRNLIPTDRNQIPNHRTTINHQEPPKAMEPEKRSDQEAPKTDLETEFETFWSAYPRKNAKGPAKKAFTKARKAISAEKLLAAVNAWPFPEPSERGDFRPYAASWLNAERWEDESVQHAMQAQAEREQFPAAQIAAHEEACRKWRASGFDGPKPKIEQFAMEIA
ncbi:helix-turn-helix domain-containing protein [Gluconobacter thailandicus]|uniref:Helix-turn-helix domain-containing protein n=1 Tax=Gluconobacter thailandicus TaxID=257438 RepID=A0AAP9JJD8_GLUTH|nr:helix-turn-helix domain-containing protein [Gluconobacter thailandicus]QEH97309.1 helix-turn-helix domain-containing protein [Gluconobacter thailandicus]